MAEIATSPENSRIRAEIWGDFVGWDDRRRGENGFLVKQLNQHRARSILDVALGDGVDTIYLLQQGFEVSANEYDDAFRQKAIENAQKEGLVIAPTALDWRRLDEKYPADLYDAVICLGNSLTCLFGRENQLAALRQFRRVLKPGGALLIDERNFQRILGNREAALKGELHSQGKYLYTGTDKVEARFAEINEDYIIIEYFYQEKGKKAYYKVYPFPLRELRSLLQEAGFSKIEQFSDYQPGNNPDADFYQYVCVK
ncbi:MAG: hypothetical protein UU56_C0017G0021 [Candidatus Curtissbacteria bacterium GW2011_GWA2_41_24]|uniref:Methyltransferase domain-containing protein n=1 Tax=Candidatus Curtissbacteria bacterium GW2011_GWA2_41_24 TaxID=1618411 RepID=A0A0G0Y2L5_9BACT|nr:MAG: hypothetical protein UU56_C0017G0021 [Candidatus Curtissbacteria bacterium GW2011_GWA2_41_24]